MIVEKCHDWSDQHCLKFLKNCYGLPHAGSQPRRQRTDWKGVWNISQRFWLPRLPRLPSCLQSLWYSHHGVPQEDMSLLSTNIHGTFSSRFSFASKYFSTFPMLSCSACVVSLACEATIVVVYLFKLFWCYWKSISL